MPPIDIQDTLFVTSHHVRQILETTESLHVNLDPFLKRRPIDWDKILKDNDATIPLHTYVALASDILETTKIPALGLKAGDRMTLLDMGLLGYAIYSSENLISAFEIARKYAPLAGSYRGGEIIISGDNASYIFESQMAPIYEELIRYDVEFEFVMWLRLAKHWDEPTNWFKEVHFTYERPRYAHLYREYFQCPMKFEQPQNLFVMDSQYLKKPFSSFNERLFKLTETECADVLADMLQVGGLSGDIRNLLARSAGQFPSSEQICEHFNVSPATLRRRLAKEGTNYKQLLRVFRLELAGTYLTETELSIDDIAVLTGYSDRANFARAFAEMYDEPPAQYRKGHGAF